MQRCGSADQQQARERCGLAEHASLLPLQLQQHQCLQQQQQRHLVLVSMMLTCAACWVPAARWAANCHSAGLFQRQSQHLTQQQLLQQHCQVVQPHRHSSSSGLAAGATQTMLHQ
jgi:hypothetical protein